MLVLYYEDILSFFLLQSPKDWQLLIAIALLVGVDVVILLIPTVIPSARLTATLTENREQPSSINVCYL